MNDKELMIFTCFMIAAFHFMAPYLFKQPMGLSTVFNNHFHIANQKIALTGVDPFNGLLKYPMLFYYIPLPIIFIEIILSFVFLPIMLYYISGLLFKKKEYQTFPTFVYLLTNIPFEFLNNYGQLCSMALISVFVYFWIKGKRSTGLLFLFPIAFGHRGSIFYVVVLCIFAIFDMFKDKLQVPIAFFGLRKWEYSTFSVNISEWILLLISFFGITKIEKNKITFSLLILFTLPSLFFSYRGILPLLYFCSIGIAYAIPKNPKDLIYPILVFAVLCQVSYIDDFYRDEYNYQTEFKDVFLMSHKNNDTYCFYPLISWKRSKETVLGWALYDVDVGPCESRRLIESVRIQAYEIANNFYETKLVNVITEGDE